MAKKKQIKSLFNEESLQAAITWFEISGLAYTIVTSNYQVKLIGSTDVKFIKGQKGKKCFIGFYKIKTDIEKTNIHIDIDKDNVQYFDSNLKELELKKIYNVDLKSAYATILKNSGLITPKTYKYICKLKKDDRLACVGMLAAKKYIFDYLGKDIINFSEETLNTENYFYFCCKKTFDVMQELKKICGNNYLFCWVDSIYYTDNKLTPLLTKKLKELKFNCSFEILREFKVIKSKDVFKITFNKNNKTKSFHIPVNNGSFSRDIVRKFIKPHRNLKLNK